MKTYYLLLLTIIMTVSCSSLREESKLENSSTKKISRVDFSNVKITDNFWTPRLKSHVTNTLPVCIDQIENKTGRMRNFENAAKGTGEHSGIFYDDSDVYKALEGMAYSLVNNPDTILEKKCDDWIAKIASAQQPDGYINTFYTLNGIEERWTNMDKHEMYCAGHLIEAAISYYKVTGKRALLDVSIGMVDHMMSIFGKDKRHWVAGHEEIELALVKLYEVTDEEKYIDFAHWLLEERGHGHGSYGNDKTWNKNYYQDEFPVRDLEKITGHAVRATYLFCGMADVAAIKKDSGYVKALNRLWDDVVLKKMYITGGIGSSRMNEGFTEDYDLPNFEAYCETCASVGMVLWSSRMNQLTGDSKYIDVLERSMYNGVLAGISLKGDRFFYVNPLASKGEHHRKEWYGTACCPSQISRFLPSIGNYIYGLSDGGIWVNLYMGNVAEIKSGKDKFVLHQETNYPWDGEVKLSIISLNKPIKRELRLRIPDWCKNHSVKVNDIAVDGKIENGYFVIDKKWKKGDVITLNLDMPAVIVAADPRVKENIGKRAVQRGPIVYCLEEVDNPLFKELKLSTSTQLNDIYNPFMLNGIVSIKAVDKDQEMSLIPYFAWDNREPGEMKVWIDYNE